MIMLTRAAWITVCYFVTILTSFLNLYTKQRLHKLLRFVALPDYSYRPLHVCFWFYLYPSYILYIHNQRGAFWVQMCPAARTQWITLLNLRLHKMKNTYVRSQCHLRDTKTQKMNIHSKNSNYRHNNLSVRAQQTQNICVTFVQRRGNVFDVDPTLYKCYANVL